MERYFNTIKDFKPLPKDKEREYFKRAQNGDKIAYEKLMSANLKFVISVAKQYQNQGLPLDELIAEGNLGLVKAYNKFDLSYKTGFITYAVWWIRQSIMNAIHENSKLIRLPSNKIAKVTKINKARQALQQKLFRDPIPEEICIHLSGDMTEEVVLEALKFSYTYVPLDAPQTDNNKTLHEIIEGDILDNPEHLTGSLKKELKLVMSEFTEREQQIISMYFGIDQPRNYTLEEIGVDLGLTRERIRQIKLKILEKLKMTHRSDKLRVYFEDDIYNE